MAACCQPVLPISSVSRGSFPILPQPFSVVQIFVHRHRGDDAVGGGRGNDSLFGGAGADRVHGGPGNDVLHALAADDQPDLLFIDLHLVHEVTSPQAFDGLRMAGRRVRHPELTVATEDHNVPTQNIDQPIADLVSRTQVDALRSNAAEFGIPIFSLGNVDQGIVHVVGPQLGLTQPGMTVVCGDSHTATHGAFGALAFSATGGDSLRSAARAASCGSIALTALTLSYASVGSRGNTENNRIVESGKRCFSSSTTV